MGQTQTSTPVPLATEDPVRIVRDHADGIFTWSYERRDRAGLLQFEFADAGDPDAAPDPLGTAARA